MNENEGREANSFPAFFFSAGRAARPPFLAPVPALGQRHVT